MIESRCVARHLFSAIRAGARASAAALWLSACAGGHADEGDVVTEWQDGGSAIAVALREERLIEEIVGALNQTFSLPSDLLIVHTTCGAENAFYDPQSRQITMCYELLDAVAEVAWEQAQYDEQRYRDLVLATWTFVLFHELGHGLIHLYDLPVATREEDAVDAFSTVLMIKGQMSRSALLAARYWAETDSGNYTHLSYAGAHSLNAQRFYNIVCLVYGSSVEAYQEIVERDVLPRSRAVGCRGEYEQARQSWERLLAAWVRD